MKIKIVGIILALACLWGCTPTEPADKTDEEAVKNAAKGAASPAPSTVPADAKPTPAMVDFGKSAGGGMPLAGMKMTATPELDTAIEKAEKDADKTKIGAAYADRGYVRMNDDAASPKIKYRTALSDFKKSLAADPKNVKALKAKKAIEDVYASMGIPVPDVQ
jgi:hypothetical protein